MYLKDSQIGNMALKQIMHGTSEYKQMLDLRYELLRKPLGLRFEQEELEKEKEDILIAAFDEAKMLGCCLLTRINQEKIKLRQMAVLNNNQGKGIGASLMSFAETLARDNGYTFLVMHARKVAVGFYEKQGYTVDGDEFIEVTIPHYERCKKIR
jgi:GNAT superfamily N-acetyltransferase